MSGYGGFGGFGSGMTRNMTGGTGGMSGGSNQFNQTNGNNDYGTGGGFMNQGAGGYGSTQADAGGGGGKKMSNQSLRPVTIQQFHEAKQIVPDGPYTLDGAELTNVVLCGTVNNIHEQSTTVTYVIDDGTGTVTSRKWLDPEENTDRQAQKRSLIREGVDVKVFGAIGKPFQNKNGAGPSDAKTMTVFVIKPTSHPEERVYHNLEAQYASLYFTKGSLQRNNPGIQNGGYGGGQQAGPNNNPYGGNSGGYGGYGSFGNQPNLATARPNSNAYNPSAPPTRNYNNGLSAVQNKILDLCRGSGNEGAHITNLIQQLRSHGNEGQIRGEIDYLVGEGHLYSTIDDDHFGLVDANA